MEEQKKEHVEANEVEKESCEDAKCTTEKHVDEEKKEDKKERGHKHKKELEALKEENAKLKQECLFQGICGYGKFEKTASERS